MIGYRYDNDGYYVGESRIQKSPLEQGVFLMPPNTSTVEPPLPPPNTIPKWDGENWVLLPNYSGVTYYSKTDKSEKRFERDEEFDNNYTLKEPPTESYKEWSESENNWIDNVNKLNEFKTQHCKSIAKELIRDLDWVIDEETSPKLLNKSEFIAYRSALRALIINPQTEPTWPPRPEEVWE